MEFTPLRSGQKNPSRKRLGASKKNWGNIVIGELRPSEYIPDHPRFDQLRSTLKAAEAKKETFTLTSPDA